MNFFISLPEKRKKVGDEKFDGEYGVPVPEIRLPVIGAATLLL
jgi:hypothetical protein